MSRWLIAAHLATLLLAGCAFSLDGPDPKRPRNLVPQCDTSKGLVALDGVMATALGVVSLSLVSESEPALALLPLALGAIYAGGAVSGNRAVNECRAARNAFDAYPGEQLVLDDDDEQHVRPPRARREAVAQPPYAPPPMPESPAAQDSVAPPVVAQPVVAQPRQPAQSTPAMSPPQRRAPAPPATAESEDWSEFWREVP